MKDQRDIPPAISEKFIHFGEPLKQERLRQGLSIPIVSKETGINITNLIALEDGERRQLPADVFTCGFIKLYAKFLHIDPKKSLDNYKRTWGFTNGIEGATVYLAGGEMAEPASILEDKQALAFIGIVVLVAAIFLALQFFRPIWQRDNTAKQVPYSSPIYAYPAKALPRSPAFIPQQTPLFSENHGIEKDTPEQENIDHKNLYSTYEEKRTGDNAMMRDSDFGQKSERKKDVLPETLPAKMQGDTKQDTTENFSSAPIR